MASHKVRAASALALVGVLGVAGALNFRSYSRIRNQTQPDPYRIQYRMDKLESVQAMIPPHARVGYVSDLPVSDIREQVGYLATAYALAPRLVVHVEKAQPGDYVIGEFSKATDYAAFGTARGLAVERHSGDIVLYRKPGR